MASKYGSLKLPALKEELRKRNARLSGSKEELVERSRPELWREAGVPPHNVTPIKGGVHVALARDFVDYILHGKEAKDLLGWAKKVVIPDEIVFSTLNHNPQLQIPGSYKGIIRLTYQIAAGQNHTGSPGSLTGGISTQHHVEHNR